ncbi:MAG: hypothetical protein CMP11_07580 [Zetaproteobacteria bacterium]|nr:hypothetical protein [Pseudobdellovibrionaceae bacterium]|tara:strand:- start:1413 stop:2306 length:894 start_codon:yes stop_codon:yes gene_type:complete
MKELICGKLSRILIWLVIKLISFFPLVLIREKIFIFFFPSFIIKRTKGGKQLFSNIKAVFPWAKDEKKLLLFAKKNFYHQTIIFIETLKIIANPSIKVKIEGFDELSKNMKRAEKGSNPPLIFSGHIGNWEYLGHLCAMACNHKFYALAKPVSSILGENFLKWLREKLKINILWTGKNNFQREMIRTMRNKNWVAFLMDQKPFDRVGPKVNFFNRQTEFVAGPAKMAIRFKSPVVSAFCIRKAPFHYKIISSSLNFDYEKEETVEDITQCFAKQIECIIKEHPEQWCWTYKRWKNLT